MKKKRARFLPEYVSRYRDRHKKWRYRFRRKGFPGGHFTTEFGTEAFRQEYTDFKNGAPEPAEGIERYAHNTIGHLVARFCATPSRLGPSAGTQKKVRGVLYKFRAEHGHNPVALVRFEHIDAIIEAKREKVWTGKRWEGGIEAARRLRKILVRLFAFAKKTGMHRENPAEDADRVKVAAGQRSKGFHTWTEEEITQFRDHHKLGSKPRLAMELLLWTGHRRDDGIRTGPDDIRDGRFEMRQGKTGTDLGLLVAPQLLEAIAAMPPLPPGAKAFLLTMYGKPYSNGGFGNWFRDQCNDAGLTNCTAHGLRKAIMRRMAEIEQTNQSMKSVSGHVNDEEVAGYTREANQRRMADKAIGALSQWEMSNLRERLDIDAPQPPLKGA